MASEKATPAPRMLGGLPIGKSSAMVEPNSILLYGKAKIGKTRLAGSIIDVSNYENVLLIDCEKGGSTLNRAYPNVDVVQIPYMDARTLTNTLDEINDDPTGAGYDAVIVDTLSTAQNWILRAITGGKKAEFDHWSAFGEGFMDMVWQCHHAKPLYIFNFHQMTVENKLTGEIETHPFVKSAAKNSIANVPDIVAHMKPQMMGGQPERVVRLGISTSADSGNRIEELPDALVNPDMPTIFSYIRGELDADGVPTIPEPQPIVTEELTAD